MRRPPGAREALRLRPLVQACRADSSGVERVPLMTALAEPVVSFARSPAAERAADARRLGSAGFLLFVKRAIRGDDPIFCAGSHTRYYGLIRTCCAYGNARIGTVRLQPEINPGTDYPLQEKSAPERNYS